MKKTVYNRNFLRLTNENMKRIDGVDGIESDYRMFFGVTTPQMTFYSHLVPPRAAADVEPPFIVTSIPTDEGFLGAAFTYQFTVEFNELVSNATAVSNYAFSGGAVGTLVVSSVRELSPSSSGGTVVLVETSGEVKSPGTLFLTVGGSSDPIADSAGNLFVTEQLGWFVDHEAPLLDPNDISPATYDRIDLLSWDYRITLFFNEYLLDNSDGWRDPSNYSVVLKAEGTSTADEKVVIKDVNLISSSPFEYGFVDGELTIELVLEKPSGNLTAFNTVEFEVTGRSKLVDRANNPLEDLGVVSWSAEAQASLSVPSAPSFTGIIQALDGAVRLTLTASSDDGGSPITEYLVYQSEDGVTWQAAAHSTIIPDVDFVVSGLSNGTTYSFRATARNGVGESLPSDISAAMPFGAPNTPSISADVDNENITLNITSNGDGGSPITRFKIEEREGVLGTWTDSGLITNALTVVRPLNLYDTFYRVIAVNAFGESAPTSPVGGFARTMVPDPVTITNIDGGDETLTVNYVLGSDNNSPITSVEYLITTSVDDLSGGFTSVEAGTSFTISGLTNGQEYIVYLRAVNDLGYGESRSDTGTPVGLPKAPQLTVMGEGDTTVSLMLTADPDDGGSEILSYTVEVSASGESMWIPVPGLSITSGVEFDVATMVNDSLFYFRAYATNAVGDGAYSDVVSATPTAPQLTTVPEAPTLELVEVLDRAVKLVLTASPDDGGSEIQRYDVEVSGEGLGGIWITAPLLSITPGEVFEVGTMVNDSLFYFRAYATNSVGQSPRSEPIIEATPTAPQPVTAPPTPNLISVETAELPGSVNIAFSSGGDHPVDIVRYEVQYTGAGGSTAILDAGLASPFVLGGLNPGEQYMFEIRAVDSNGEESDFSAPGLFANAGANPSSAEDVPSTIRVLAVTSLTVTGSGEPEVWVAYQQPTSVGSDVTQYEVSLYQYEAKDDWRQAPITGDAVVTQTFPVVSGVAPTIQIPVTGREGEVLVAIMRAENSAGWSQPSVGYIIGEDGVHDAKDSPASVEVGRLILTPVIENVDVNSSEGSVTIQWKEADVLFDHSHEETTVTSRSYELIRNLGGSFEALYFPLTLAPSEVFPGGGQNPTITTEFTDLADGYYYFRFHTANAYMAENQDVRDWQKSERTGLLQIQREVSVTLPPTPNLDGVETTSDSIIVSFSSGGDHSAAIARYEIKYDNPDAGPTVVDAGLTSPFTIGGLSAGRYAVQVRVVDVNGVESEYTLADLADIEAAPVVPNPDPVEPDPDPVEPDPDPVVPNPGQAQPDPPMLSGVVEGENSVRLTITPPEYTGVSPLNTVVPYKLFVWHPVEERFVININWLAFDDLSRVISTIPAQLSSIDGIDSPLDVIYAVMAFNDRGGSDLSNQVGPFTPPVVETPPTPILQGLEAGINQITVSFGSGGDHSVDIARYEIQYTGAGGSTAILDAGLTSPFTVSGLNGGEQYMIEVRAVDLNGVESAWTSSEFATTETEVVGIERPTLTAEGPTNSGIVTLTASTQSSGNTFHFDKSVDGVSWEMISMTTDSVIEFDMGANIGQQYRFFRVAIHNDEMGPWSQYVFVPLFYTKPTLLAIESAGNNMAKLRWTAASTLQEDMSLLRYRYSVNGGSDWVEIPNSASLTEWIVPQNAGTTTEYILRADFSNGIQLISEPRSFTAPIFPTIESVVQNGVELVVTVDLQQDPSNVSTLTLKVDNEDFQGDGNPDLVSKVNPATQVVTFTVDASPGVNTFNAKIQFGDWSDDFTYTVPSFAMEAPTGITVSSVEEGLSIAPFNAPPLVHDLPIQAWDFTWDGGRTWHSVMIPNIDVNGWDSNFGGNIVLGQAYVIQVRAWTKVGRRIVAGAWSEAGEPVIAGTSLTAPMNMSLTWSSGTATMNWDAPLINATGSPLSNYQWSVNGGESWNVINDSSELSSWTFAQEAGTSVTYLLRAVTVSGVVSDHTSFFLYAASVPDAPVLFAPTWDSLSGNTTLSWTTPADTGGVDINYYEYTTNYQSGSTSMTWTKVIGSNSVEIPQSAGQSMRFAVRTVNVGRFVSEPSLDISFTPELPQISSPTITDMVWDNGVATMNWETPDNATGSSLSNYQYSTNGDTWNTMVGSRDLNTWEFEHTAGSTVTYYLRAVTQDGDISEPNMFTLLGAGVPGFPTDLSGSWDFETQTTTVSWTPPENTGGVAISHYEWATTNNTTTTWTRVDGTSLQKTQRSESTFQYFVRTVNTEGLTSEPSPGLFFTAEPPRVTDFYMTYLSNAYSDVRDDTLGKALIELHWEGIEGFDYLHRLDINGDVNTSQWLHSISISPHYAPADADPEGVMNNVLNGFDANYNMEVMDNGGVKLNFKYYAGTTMRTLLTSMYNVLRYWGEKPNTHSSFSQTLNMTWSYGPEWDQMVTLSPASASEDYLVSGWSGGARKRTDFDLGNNNVPIPVVRDDRDQPNVLVERPPLSVHTFSTVNEAKHLT